MKKYAALIIILALSMALTLVLASCDPADGEISDNDSNGVIDTSSKDTSSHAASSAPESSAPEAESSAGGAESSADGAESGNSTGDQSQNDNNSGIGTGEVSGLSAYFTPSEINEVTKVTVSKQSASRYIFTADIFDGEKMQLNLDKKSWGTYILGSWILKKGTDSINFTGGSTDMEYVYRAGATSGSWVWSGGNHGNEELVEIALYNGDNDKLLTFSDGKAVTCDSVKVVQKTRLNWGDTAVWYAEVTRNYTITASRIVLDVDYKYVLDCYHRLSYTCMFPIAKTHGIYAAFFNGSELIDVIETSKVGTDDYKGPMYKGFAADRVVMYGYKQPEYKIEACVTTITDSLDDFKNADKTFFWDMNKNHNKLYFSKYSSDIPTLVPAGTEFHTSCMWTMLKDAEG